MEDKISIIMASYNYSNFLPEAIESVINQTYKNWELIAVDDASSDNSVEIIQNYAKNEPRIKLFTHDTNKGLASAIQTGVENSTGKWIAFLESDDIWKADSLEEKYKITSTGADIIFSDVETFYDINDNNRKGELFTLSKYMKNRKSGFIDDFDEIIYRTNIIPTFSCVILKKSLLEECKYNPLCKACLDWYLWCQLAHKKVYYIDKKLTRWRLHSDSFLNRDKNSFIKSFAFNIQYYYQTIKNKNLFLKIFLLLNFIRRKIIYIKINKNAFKINILELFIFEKELK